MKKLLFVSLLLLSIPLIGTAQDILVLNSGDEIEAKIEMIDQNVVKYKTWGNQDGPLRSINKSELFMIKYKNGEKEMMESANSPVAQATNTSQQGNVESTNKIVVVSEDEQVMKQAPKKADTHFGVTSVDYLFIDGFISMRVGMLSKNRFYLEGLLELGETNSYVTDNYVWRIELGYPLYFSILERLAIGANVGIAYNHTVVGVNGSTMSDGNIGFSFSPRIYLNPNGAFGLFAGYNLYLHEFSSDMKQDFFSLGITFGF